MKSRVLLTVVGVLIVALIATIPGLVAWRVMKCMNQRRIEAELAQIEPSMWPSQGTRRSSERIAMVVMVYEPCEDGQVIVVEDHDYCLTWPILAYAHGHDTAIPAVKRHEFLVRLTKEYGNQEIIEEISMMSHCHEPYCLDKLDPATRWRTRKVFYRDNSGGPEVYILRASDDWRRIE